MPETIRLRKRLASIGIGSMGILGVMFSFTARESDKLYARIDEKDRAVRAYVNEKHESVVHQLDRIQEVLDRVDQRVYEMKRKQGR